MTSPTPQVPSAAQLRSSRVKLVIIFLLFAFPIIGSTALFYMWRPEKTTNYGQMLQPAVDVGLSKAVAAAREQAANKGRWLLIQRESNACEQACKERLQLARNIHVALNKYSDRLGRVAIVSAADPTAQASLPETKFVPTPDTNDAINSVMPGDGFLLVDPRNFAVLRYPLELDGKLFLKDANRLMKYSVPPSEVQAQSPPK